MDNLSNNGNLEITEVRADSQVEMELDHLVLQK